MSSAGGPYVGVGVSKVRLDVALLLSGELFAVPNDEEGLQELGSQQIRRSAACPGGSWVAILEASGGFGRPVVAAPAATEAAVAMATLDLATVTV